MTTSSRAAPRRPGARVAARRALPATLLLFLFGCHGSPRPERAVSDRVVLITVEDLAAGDLGCGGAPDQRTPWIDRFARGGRQAADALSPATTPRSGLATLLTGLPAGEHGLVREDFALADARSLPETLERRGVRTGAFAGTAAADRRHGLGRGFARHEEPYRPGTDRVGEPWNEAGRAEAGALSRLLEDWLVDADGTPTFAWVHLGDRVGGTPADADRAFGTILRALGDHPSALVVVTSPGARAADQPIPLIAAGPGVPRGVRAGPTSLADATAILAAAFAGAEPLGRALEDPPADRVRRPSGEVPPLASEAGEALARARALDRSGDPQGALAAYDRAYRAEPRLVAARQRLAELSRALGHPEESAEAAREVLARVPDHPEALVLLGRLLAAGREADRASTLVQTVLAASPRHAGALAARAELEILRGNPTAAVRDLRAALGSAGGRSDELAAISGGLSRAGLHPEAVAAARRALDTGDQSPPTRYALAFALAGAERYAESVAEYASLIRDYPAYLPPYRNLGAMMARDGEIERAIGLWESGLEIRPDDPGLLANVEEARKALGLGTLGGQR